MEIVFSNTPESNEEPLEVVMLQLHSRSLWATFRALRHLLQQRHQTAAEVAEALAGWAQTDYESGIRAAQLAYALGEEVLSEFRIRVETLDKLFRIKPNILGDETPIPPVVYLNIPAKSPAVRPERPVHLAVELYERFRRRTASVQPEGKFKPLYRDVKSRLRVSEASTTRSELQQLLSWVSPEGMNRLSGLVQRTGLGRSPGTTDSARCSRGVARPRFGVHGSIPAIG